MDGVLFPFDPLATAEELNGREYYINMQPVSQMWMIVREMVKTRGQEHFILSAYLTQEAREGKILALKKMGNIFPEKRQIFVPYSEGKVKYAEAAIGRRLGRDCILLDDHTPNCVRWTLAGGTAIKVLNGINDRSGTWKGLKLSKTGEIIAPKIIYDHPHIVDDLVYAIYKRAIDDLEIFDSGSAVVGESYAGIRKWMQKSEFGINGQMLLKAYDLKKEGVQKSACIW